MFAVSLRDVGLSYEDKVLFEGVNLNIPAGAFCILTGVSGSGKTSLLKMLYMDHLSTWGKIEVLGNNTRLINDKAELRRNMGIVFQDFKLIDEMNVLENVILPLKIRNFPLLESINQGKKILEWAGIKDIYAYPSVLSGGEKQLVGIARAVISKPEIVIADEPIENLDRDKAEYIVKLLWELNKIGMTVIISTHNERIVKNFGNAIHFCIKNSCIVSC